MIERWSFSRFFNAATMSTTLACAPWCRRDSFYFLTFHFLLDHGKRALAVFDRAYMFCSCKKMNELAASNQIVISVSPK